MKKYLLNMLNPAFVIAIVMQRLYKYYYKTENGGFCKEYCYVKDDGCKIGSINCKECNNCKGYSQKHDWIICSKIKKAAIDVA